MSKLRHTPSKLVVSLSKVRIVNKILVMETFKQVADVCEAMRVVEEITGYSFFAIYENDTKLARSSIRKGKNRRLTTVLNNFESFRGMSLPSFKFKEKMQTFKVRNKKSNGKKKSKAKGRQGQGTKK